jgi:hypothetical protein
VRWFWFYLTLCLGHRSVAEAQASISGAEFAEWQAFWRVTPFGPWADYHRAALIQATGVNKWLPKGQRPYPPEDFMPPFFESDEPDPDEIWASVERCLKRL